MKSEKLASLIAKEIANIENLEAKKEEIEEKLKKSRTKLQEYRMMENSQKYGALSSAVSQKGLSLDDILSALQNGDLLSLQEQMEAAENKNEDGEDNNIASESDT